MDGEWRPDTTPNQEILSNLKTLMDKSMFVIPDPFLQYQNQGLVGVSCLMYPSHIQEVAYMINDYEILDSTQTSSTTWRDSLHLE